MGTGNVQKVLSRYTATVSLRRGGTEALIVERGARLLSLNINGVNPLWVNPSLEKVLSTSGWNTGGLRLWFSPERNFFYEKPEVFEGWFCPSSLDPGRFKLTYVDSSKAVLDGSMEAVDLNTGWRLYSHVRREFHLTSEDKLIVRDIVYADYPGVFNLWALAQVEPGARGTVIVPVERGAEPVHYFGPIPRDRLYVSEDHLSFKIDGARVCKLGVKPEDVPCEGHSTIAYVAEIDERWVLLLLRTCDAPRDQEECLDVAKADPRGPRGCIQSYNSGPEAGPERFGEIELHFKPAVEVGGRKVAWAEYEIISTSGTRDDVLERLKMETGLKAPKLF
ncbi:MAG: hypothetical protein NZ954_01535 [Thermofilaceae archaeon]|nr:hypothetical protein [Thermofilaceae archaeon]